MSSGTDTIYGLKRIAIAFESIADEMRAANSLRLQELEFEKLKWDTEQKKALRQF